MPRARSNPSQQTAAAFQPQGSGCFSGYILPPLAVLIVGSLLALFALNVTPQDLTVQAAAPGTPAQSPLLDAAIQAALPGATPVPAGGSVQGQVDQIPGPPAAPPQAAIQLASPSLDVQAAPATSGALSGVFTPQIQYWGKAIVRWTSAVGIDPNLAAVVMQIESCGDPSATSRSGAIGLFQVMPYHFAASDSPYDPDTICQTGIE